MNAVPFGPNGGASDPDPFAEYDAAYVFGALAPDERMAFERHLQHCDECTAAVAALAGMPGLLSRVPIERLTDADETPVPETMLPRLVAQVNRERQRSRWRTGGAALLAAACITAVLVALLIQRHPARSSADGPSPSSASSSVGNSSSGTQSGSTGSDRPTGPASGQPSGPSSPGAGPVLAMTTVRNVGISAGVQIQDVAWGTKITMRCTEASTAAGAVPYAGSYYLVAVGKDGSQISLAGWRALPGKTVHIEGDTDLARADIRSLLLVAADREVLLKLNL